MKYKGNGNILRGKGLQFFKIYATTSMVCFVELSRRDLKNENLLHSSEVLKPFSFMIRL